MILPLFLLVLFCSLDSSSAMRGSLMREGRSAPAAFSPYREEFLRFGRAPLRPIESYNGFF
ncbi:hypothetical protein PFISCL1PPCAC_9912, partial [Pristionchus fissidentatus]